MPHVPCKASKMLSSTTYSSGRRGSLPKPSTISMSCRRVLFGRPAAQKSCTYLRSRYEETVPLVLYRRRQAPAGIGSLHTRQMDLPLATSKETMPATISGPGCPGSGGCGGFGSSFNFGWSAASSDSDSDLHLLSVVALSSSWQLWLKQGLSDESDSSSESPESSGGFADSFLNHKSKKKMRAPSTRGEAGRPRLRNTRNASND